MEIAQQSVEEDARRKAAYRAYQREYRNKNKAILAEKQKAYVAKHKERYAEYYRQYALEHSKTRAEQAALRWNKTRELITEAEREKRYAAIKKYRSQFPEKIAAYGKAYRRSDKGRAAVKAGAHRRRAREGKAISAETIMMVLSATHCYYCARALNSSRHRNPLKATIDHKQPVSKGGTNDLANLVAACWQCNCRKNNKTAEAFHVYLVENPHHG